MAKTVGNGFVDITVVKNGYLVRPSSSDYKSNGYAVTETMVAPSFDALVKLLKVQLSTPEE